MKCLQCGVDLQSNFSSRDLKEILKVHKGDAACWSNGFKSRVLNYDCKACDIGFYVMMYNIWHVENNLVLQRGGGLKVARDI